MNNLNDLKIGKLYRVEFSFYFDNFYLKKDPITKHIKTTENYPTVILLQIGPWYDPTIVWFKFLYKNKIIWAASKISASKKKNIRSQI